MEIKDLLEIANKFIGKDNKSLEIKNLKCNTWRIKLKIEDSIMKISKKEKDEIIIEWVKVIAKENAKHDNQALDSSVYKE